MMMTDDDDNNNNRKSLAFSTIILLCRRYSHFMSIRVVEHEEKRNIRQMVIRHKEKNE